MSDDPRYGQIDHDYGMKLATTAPDDDGPIWMVNLMQYREVADYADGRETTRSGREADDEYTPTGPLKAVLRKSAGCDGGEQVPVGLAGVEQGTDAIVAEPVKPRTSVTPV